MSLENTMVTRPSTRTEDLLTSIDAKLAHMINQPYMSLALRMSDSFHLDIVVGSAIVRPAFLPAGTKIYVVEHAAGDNFEGLFSFQLPADCTRQMLITDIDGYLPNTSNSQVVILKDIEDSSLRLEDFSILQNNLPVNLNILHSGIGLKIPLTPLLQHLGITIDVLQKAFFFINSGNLPADTQMLIPSDYQISAWIEGEDLFVQPLAPLGVELIADYLAGVAFELRFYVKDNSSAPNGVLQLLG